MTQGKTTPELDPLAAPLVDSDVLVAYRAPGPLKRTTASVIGTYANSVIGTAFTRSLLATADQAAFLAAFGQIDLVETNFVPSGTGAVTVTGQDKLRQAPVQPNSGEFGLFTDATVTTATLLAAFDYAIANKRPIVLSGDYTVNGPICTPSTVANGALDLRLDGDVTITVDPAATSFQYLIVCISTALNSHYISGPGSLAIVGNDKVERAISLASAVGTTTAGAEVVVSCPISVSGCYVPAGSAGLAAYGMNVTGPFERVIIDDLSVSNLSRHTSLDATGVCQGLRVSEARGPVTITRPIMRDILNAVQDADGIFVTAPVETGVPVCPAVHVIDGIFEDCQGRSIKTQSAHTVVSNPTFIRQGVVSITQGVDVDAQYGSLAVDNWTARYRLNGATSPLGSSFRPFVIQALYSDAPKFSRIGEGKLTTDVILPGLVSLVVGANSPDHEVVIDGATIQAEGVLTTSAFSRSLVEFQADQIKLSSKRLTVRVRNTTAPTSVYLIGYTGGDGTDLTTKLAVHANSNTNILAPANNTRVFNQLSGTALTNLCQTTFSINPGYHHKLTTGTVNMATIQPGHEVYVDLAGVAVTNGPSGLPSTGDALLRAGTGETTWWGLLDREIIVGNGDRIFYTVNGTWTELNTIGALTGVTTLGDAAATLTARTSRGTQIWGTTLTADRAVTLSTTGARDGDWFEIVRPAAGAFNLNVGTGPLKALPASSWCRVVYNGSAWALTAYGAL